jgi:large conductance mechanosensitive channel
VVLRGEGDFVSLAAAREAGVAVFAYGAFIMAVINFLIIAWVVFLLIRCVNKLKKAQSQAEEVAPDAAPSGPSELDILIDIRTALQREV